MQEDTRQIRREMSRLFSSFNGTKNELIPILQSVQEYFGYLPERAMLEVARFISIPESKVYGAATFYSQFRFEAKGQNHITLCRGTSCHVRGATKIMDALERHFGIKEGETTEDGAYSMEAVACIGCCALSPCMMVNTETVFGKLVPKKAVELIAALSGKEDGNAG